MKAAIAAFLLISISVAHSQIPADTQEAADKGNADAQADIGLRYLDGLNLAKDPAKAFEWFQKSASQGNLKGELELGHMYRKGDGVPKDIGKAIEWYEKVIEQEDESSLIEIANIYHDGDDIPQDYDKAMELYKKASALGDVTSLFRVGAMYYAGEGIPKDAGKAMEWFQKAAEHKSLFAMQGIALLYDNGEGVPKDPDEAAKWYKKADELSNRPADPSDGKSEDLKAFTLVRTVTITAITPMSLLHAGEIVPSGETSELGKKYIFEGLRGDSFLVLRDAANHLYQIASSATDYKSPPTVAVQTEAPSGVAPSTPDIKSVTAIPRASTLINKQVTVTLNDGTKKTGKLIRIDADSITLLTDDGGGKVLFSAMSEADRTQFGYVPPIPSEG
jgi:tetratricopeptide (TPR) repeat protein